MEIRITPRAVGHRLRCAAVLAAWSEADQALWAGVLNFWLLGRVFDRVRS